MDGVGGLWTHPQASGASAVTGKICQAGGGFGLKGEMSTCYSGILVVRSGDVQIAFGYKIKAYGVG